jgi:hypothetical protein
LFSGNKRSVGMRRKRKFGGKKFLEKQKELIVVHVAQMVSVH